MRSTLVAATLGILLAAAPLAVAQTSVSDPPGPVTIDVAGQSLTLWPYTATNYDPEASDPINLIFPDADPRAIRQALLGLDGVRPAFAGLPFGSCVWQDAMGEEQAAWAEPEDWVGSAIQLACVEPGFPLGDNFRIHVRLFREGTWTLGGAHLDVLIPGTAQHESLSWELPRQFVTYDMARAGVVTAADSVSLVSPGFFGTVPRRLYNGLVSFGAGPLLAALGLVAPQDPNADVPIPTTGQATVLATEIVFAPVDSETRSETEISYNIDSAKPFCNAPSDFVHISGGPLHLSLKTHTNAAGGYSRTYTITGVLDVTPLPAGETVKAVIVEEHLGLITDETSQAREIGSRTLLAQPTEAQFWILNAGHLDRYTSRENCAQ